MSAMAPISPVGNSTVADAGYQAPKQDVGEQEFLTLLMTQLSNQDPLNPMESQQFMEQVASMNQVQQLMDANERLDSLMMGITSLNNQSAVGLVGQEGVARGNTFTHAADQGHDLKYDLSAEAAEVTVSVLDSSGDVIWSDTSTEVAAGEGTIHWDGKVGGVDVPPGDYTFEVHAVDEEELPVEATTYISGRVDELRFDSGVPVLMVGAEEVTLDEILRVLDLDPPPIPIGNQSREYDPGGDENA